VFLEFQHIHDRRTLNRFLHTNGTLTKYRFSPRGALSLALFRNAALTVEHDIALAVREVQFLVRLSSPQIV
jgi:hypothetical protein